MRLCGISDRFQPLSPCMGQVAHALLTRPPLSLPLLHPERIRAGASFDLHVLSTPPAFILSQDQTLMFVSSFLMKELHILLLRQTGFYNLPRLSERSIQCIGIVGLVLILSLFCLSLILSHCSVVNVLFVCRSRATARILYHRNFLMSSTFLKNFDFFRRKIFSTGEKDLHRRHRQYYLTNISCSNFLHRRRWDLNPRAATNDLLPFQGSPFGQLGYFSESTT